MPKMKIAVVVCYDQTDYVRARTLRTALLATDGVEVLNIRNKHTGLLRYIEVPLKILRARFRDKPDAYLVTFRGYEMLLYMVLTLVRKPIIFDELINFTEWMDEHGILKPGSLQYRLFRRWNGSIVHRTRYVLADTEAHASYSAELNRLPLGHYRTIPVGTDETVFYPRPNSPPKTEPFTVFYYGNMLPLHGLPYVLEAALLLKDNPAIQFRFVGGKAKAAAACAAAAAGGARVIHEAWLPFEELPNAARAASLTVGGPFGDTLQSRFVVTGKTYQFLALGAPVLLGRNEVNDVFVDKQNCLVVPQADGQAIANAITWAYEHPEELNQIGKAGRQLYEERFSQATINKLVGQLVQSL